MTTIKQQLYGQFLCHYGYLEPSIERWEEVDGDLFIVLKNGERIIYDGLVDTCRTPPENPMEMSERECNLEFGSRLRKIMIRKGYNQRRLSEMTGLSPALISRYLNGRSSPGFYNVDRIARVLGCSTDDLRYF